MMTPPIRVPSCGVPTIHSYRPPRAITFYPRGCYPALPCLASWCHVAVSVAAFPFSARADYASARLPSGSRVHSTGWLSASQFHLISRVIFCWLVSDAFARDVDLWASDLWASCYVCSTCVVLPVL